MAPLLQARALVLLVAICASACAEEGTDVLLELERADASVRLRLDICRDLSPPLECSDGGTLFEEQEGPLTRTVGIRVDDAFTEGTFRLIVHIERSGESGFTRCYSSRIRLISIPFSTSMSVDATGEAPSLACIATGECDPFEVCE